MCYLEVVEEALGERGVRVEVDEVRGLLGLEEADGVAVLLDGHAHLGKHRLPGGREQ